MEALRSWWNAIQKHRVAIGVGVTVLAVVIAIIIIGYQFDWTGFNGYTKIATTHNISGTNAGTVTRTEEYQPGRGLWDWLQLLIIPLALAVIALVFQLANTRTEHQIAKERYEQDRQIAKQRYEQDQEISLDKQHEDLLQAYLDRMSELLLKEKLRSSEVDAEVRNVARVRTITVLAQLDAGRVGYVFAFLREAGLLLPNSDKNVVSLYGAILDGVDWGGAILMEANLRGVHLYKADLFGAILANANLSQASLQAVNLKCANLIGANLRGSYLGDANLNSALLINADLTNADLTKASLIGAVLINANLKDAKVTDEQLAEAKSLEGATMPDG